jgi:signal peptidase I
MEPSIRNGEEVLATNILYLFKKPKINDIVALRHNNQIFIKRIVAVVNEKYFVEGDNKKDSLDSKDFGLLSKNQILGKVIIKL